MARRTGMAGGFTLVETLIVILIISILIGILAPALISARRRAQEVVDDINKKREEQMKELEVNPDGPSSSINSLLETNDLTYGQQANGRIEGGGLLQKVVVVGNNDPPPPGWEEVPVIPTAGLRPDEIILRVEMRTSFQQTVTNPTPPGTYSGGYGVHTTVDGVTVSDNSTTEIPIELDREVSVNTHIEFVELSAAVAAIPEPSPSHLLTVMAASVAVLAWIRESRPRAAARRPEPPRRAA